MRKTLFLLILLCLCNVSCAYQSLNEIEIAGKIVDQDGNLVTDEVTLTVELESVTYPDVWKPGAKTFEEQIKSETQILEKKVYGGTFSWKLPNASFGNIKASKENYHEDCYRFHDEGNKIIVNDLMLRLVKTGIPSKLEYVEGAIIPGRNNKKSGGKDCGWSFKKLWYFPVAEEDTIWLTKSYDEDGNVTYTMKEPGGFVSFSGYPQRESVPDELYAWFDWMPRAPETGYIPSVRLSDYKESGTAGEVYFYFKTPDGKYGKICFHGDFDYYLQPDGSRDLEAGEVKELGPVNPKEKEWEDKWSK